MKVIWEVEDGYTGKSAPQETIISDDELEDFETEDERNKFIDECVQEDFAQKVSFSITRLEE